MGVAVTGTGYAGLTATLKKGRDAICELGVERLLRGKLNAGHSTSQGGNMRQ